jgi:hypothetical protein
MIEGSSGGLIAQRKLSSEELKEVAKATVGDLSAVVSAADLAVLRAVAFTTLRDENNSHHVERDGRIASVLSSNLVLAAGRLIATMSPHFGASHATNAGELAPDVKVLFKRL